MSPQDDADPLFEEAYTELKAVAAGFMRGGGGVQTLSPTVLVHETYLRLAHKPELDWADRSHFFRTACKVLRRVVIEYARRKKTLKRGGDRLRLTLQGIAVESSRDVDVLDLEAALTELDSLDERKARVVELKYFCGLANHEVAETLEISRATVETDWRFARAWLSKRLDSDPSDPERAH